MDRKISVIELYAKNKSGSHLYNILLLLFFSILVVFLQLKIDISSQSKGITKSIQEPIYLSSLQNGKVLHHQLTTNGVVKQGDTLLVLSQQQLKIQAISQDSLLSDKKAYKKDMSFLIENQSDSLSTFMVLATYNDYINQVRELNSRVILSQKNYNRQKQLFDKGVIAAAEYEEHLFNLRFAQQKLSSFKKSQKANWNATRLQLENEIINIQSSINQLQLQEQEYVITAPISGTLEKVLPLSVYSNVMAGQQLGLISPDTDLIIENTVAPSDIGLLQIGQKVTVQFDAFNYNQWGMIEGKVIEIDKNITITENGSYFKVKCKLDKNSLTLKNGYNATIKKGMTATTRFFITRRKLSDLLFDKVDDWFNPKLQ
jgi:multidrug resistance efflux pump